MKTYIGKRDPYSLKTSVRILEPNRPTRRLPLWKRLRNHSPDGFDWGYNGSAPAQLALALLMDATGCAATALGNYQELKRKWVALLDDDEWTVRQEDLIAFVDDGKPIGSL